MPEEVTIDKVLGIIKVRSFGKVTLSEMKESMKAIERIHNENSYLNVLLTIQEITSLPSIFQIFEFGTSFLKFKTNQRIKYAVVTNERFFDKAEFLENVSINRGIMLKAFKSQDVALEWLNK